MTYSRKNNDLFKLKMFQIIAYDGFLLFKAINIWKFVHKKNKFIHKISDSVFEEKQIKI